jgi:hypothetical protein
MDELDLLLGGLREEQPPQEALDRVKPRVERAIARRRVTQWTLAAAAALVAATLLSIPRETEPIALPEPVRAIIPVPDLILSAPAPVTLSSHRAKQPRARSVDANTVELASTDPNIKILWSM